MSSTPGRARRANIKRVDYAKEQEFSDAEDIFEDSDDEPVAPVRARKSTGRRSAGGGAKKSSAKARSATTPAGSDDDDMNDNDGFGGGGGSNRPVYTEKGYDPTLLPIRERFPFLPEYEEDGSPKIDLIVGRRPVDEEEDIEEANKDENDDENGKKTDDDMEVDEEDEEEVSSGRRSRRSAKNDKKKKKQKSPAKKKRGSMSPEKGGSQSGPVEYEYLVKYKGRSYLHLEWKRGADLESMNKSAKGIYRRYLKKIAQGTEEDIENPEFDPSYVIPQKIVDEADQEISVEYTDKELLKWEKQREKELALEQKDDDEDENEVDTPKKEASETTAAGTTENGNEKKGTVLFAWIHDRCGSVVFLILTYVFIPHGQQMMPMRIQWIGQRKRLIMQTCRWIGCGVSLIVTGLTIRNSQTATIPIATASSRRLRKSRVPRTSSFKDA